MTITQPIEAATFRDRLSDAIATVRDFAAEALYLLLVTGPVIVAFVYGRAPGWAPAWRLIGDDGLRIAGVWSVLSVTVFAYRLWKLRQATGGNGIDVQAEDHEERLHVLEQETARLDAKTHHLPDRVLTERGGQ